MQIIYDVRKVQVWEFVFQGLNIGKWSTGHGSSEGHEMLKRSDKYHSIADDVPIPKM